MSAEIPSKVITTLSILVLGAMVMILNETSLSVALPAIMADYSIPATSAQWLLTGFMLTMAVVIPTTGFLLERLTTRQIFVASVGLFLAGTVVAALAPSFFILLVGRVLQAGGTALMIPTLMTVAMTLVPAQRRGTVMGIISVVISVAPALGPTVGGAILNHFTWHAIFWSMVPLIALILIAGLWRLDNVGENRDTPLDGLSVILSAFAFGGLIYGLSSMEKILQGGGWVDIAVTVVGVIALAVFIRRQRRLALEDRALMDLRPFRVRNFTLAVIILLLSFGLMLGMVTVLPIYLQTTLGATAFATGLVVMPGGILQAFLSPIVGRLFDSYGPRPLMIPGSLLMVAGLWLMATLGENSAVWMVVGMHVIFSLGMCLMMTPLMTTALSSLPKKLYSHGSAIMNTFQQLAGATGTALLVVFLTRGTLAGAAAGLSPAAATAQGTHWAFLFAGVAGIAIAVIAPLLKRAD
ncbi:MULTISPECIES: MDR family MFS transporter [unclassified Corynebacterium]|uniref:MDR family MFS transporter n=1 Tax=unclassified Corynebacterium TaxID=2624378 RepID=UPI0008A5D018|nr:MULTISPECIES: MDR family MFS transporter [unclassified Corynebacterium]OFO22683.1 MFS transporter permease [Corynebacterium sp. HMSC056F09]OFO97469.1 MFS transporter permease [Corynebacterium sp. HMSC034H07]